MILLFAVAVLTQRDLGLLVHLSDQSDGDAGFDVERPREFDCG